MDASTPVKALDFIRRRVLFAAREKGRETGPPDRALVAKKIKLWRRAWVDNVLGLKFVSANR